MGQSSEMTKRKQIRLGARIKIAWWWVLLHDMNRLAAVDIRYAMDDANIVLMFGFGFLWLSGTFLLLPAGSTLALSVHFMPSLVGEWEAIDGSIKRDVVGEVDA
jgi:hypothetical protein